MSRYLDPKTDIVFKKIFGQHPHLLKSFLNAVLPLSADGRIVSLEYLPGDQVPVIPSFKYTVVDVRCTDQQGRTFIVEMQIQWTTSFKQRMLFNASKAYVNQLEEGEAIGLERGEAIGLEKGEAIGLEKGVAMEKYVLARKLLAKGVSPEDIASLTELPIATIQALKLTKSVPDLFFVAR